MSDTLHLCPCCGKLVPASHFRRAPWTEQDISEMLVNPRLRKWVLGVVKEAVDAHVLSEVIASVRRVASNQRIVKVPRVKRASERVLPMGWITYNEAVTKYKLRGQWVRQYVSKKRVNGGDGALEEASLVAFLAVHRFHRKPRKAA